MNEKIKKAMLRSGSELNEFSHVETSNKSDRTRSSSSRSGTPARSAVTLSTTSHPGVLNSKHRPALHRSELVPQPRDEPQAPHAAVDGLNRRSRVLTTPPASSHKQRAAASSSSSHRAEDHKREQELYQDELAHSAATARRQLDARNAS